MKGISKKGNRISTGIYVDPEQWQNAKIEAIKRGIGLSDLVELALKKELKK